MPRPNLQPDREPQERSSAELTAWLFAFPVLGGVILGVVGRQAYQRGGEMGAREWFSIALGIGLGLVAVVLPPTIALRELRRRRLEREEDEEQRRQTPP